MIRITSIDSEVETENFKIKEINLESSIEYQDKPNDNDANDPINKNNNVDSLTIISREREIFLRAALQLLDRKDFTSYDTPRSNSLGRERSESVAYFQCLSSNVIRSGKLKKASRGGAFSGSTIWKVKYIEISHGIFTYEDENHGFIENWSGTFESKPNQKTIALNIDTCRCRPYKIKNGHNDMFELNVAGGPRRIWQAATEEERDEWVNAIKNAMIGSAGDFIGHNVGQPAVSINEPMKRSVTKTFMSALDRNSYCEFGFSKRYTPGITIFKNIRSVAQNSSTIQEYREMLDALKRDKTNVTVPVSYIKMTLSSNNMFRETTTIQNLGRSVDSSQVWKDLQRDSIRVNGDTISGEHGPEAMIGAIVRHIFDKVQTIRSKISASLCEGKIQSLFDAKNDYSFDLTEAQVMACARDLLILCNRTQSGGDTYFCVDSLLCNREKELCILTPLASESDPLEIFVDIVQGTSHPVSSSNNNGNDEISSDGNYVDDDSTGITSTSTSGADIIRELSTTSTGDILGALNESLKVSSERVLSDSTHSKKSEKNDLTLTRTEEVPTEGIETRRKAQLSLNLDEQDGVTLLSSTPAKYVRKSLDESVKKDIIKVIKIDSEKGKKWDDESIISDITMDSVKDTSILRSRRHSDPFSAPNKLIAGKLKPVNHVKNYVEGTVVKHEAPLKSQDLNRKNNYDEKKEQREQPKGGFLAMLKTPLRKKRENIIF